MIKKIIIVFIILLLLAAGVGVFIYLHSFHTLTVNVSSDVSEVSISKDNKLIKKMSSSGKISLQDGTYSVTPGGEKIDGSTLSVLINGKDTALSVDPNYSKNYLATLLNSEVTSITQVTEQLYPNVFKNFKLADESLYVKGEWYAATLTKIVDNSNESNDVYRFILKKNGDSWESVVSPRLIISQHDAQNVPTAIVDKVNLLNGSKDAYRTGRATIDNDYYNPQGE